MLLINEISKPNLYAYQLNADETNFMQQYFAFVLKYLNQSSSFNKNLNY